MTISAHLAILPIVVPLFAGALMLFIDERRFALKGSMSILTAAASAAIAVALTVMAATSPPVVYRLGAWPAPFGIVVVVDRLSALMVLLASTLGLAAALFSTARWHRGGPRFHALLQFLLMGVNGAFLTGDLFNLFVFFEVLLVASYGLALYGSGTARVRASLHYISVNLVASLLFLVGATLIYGVTGTLNMADLAVRIPALAARDRVLMEAGAAVLGVAFLTKAGMWPLSLWLPNTYSATSPPAAALFALLTKVGVYVVLRTWTLFFPDTAEIPRFGGDVLMAGGLATLAFGTIGVLASQNLSRVTAYSLVVSAGTLLAAVASDDARMAGAALYYLVVSTVGASLMFLLVDIVERGRGPAAQILAITAEAYVEPEEVLESGEEVGFAIPGTMAVLGTAFLLGAVVIAGFPPLGGFIAKFGLMDALLRAEKLSLASWLLLALLVVSGFAAMVSLGRAGVRRFWASDEPVPRIHLAEIVAVTLLLGVCTVLTTHAGAAMEYLDLAARALYEPQDYVRGVLSEP